MINRIMTTDEAKYHLTGKHMPRPSKLQLVSDHYALAIYEINRLNGIVESYDQLINHVVYKFPTETRHETAIRYIQEAELSREAAHQARIGSNNKDQ